MSDELFIKICTGWTIGVILGLIVNIAILIYVCVRDR